MKKLYKKANKAFENYVGNVNINTVDISTINEIQAIGCQLKHLNMVSEDICKGFLNAVIKHYNDKKNA